MEKVNNPQPQNMKFKFVGTKGASPIYHFQDIYMYIYVYVYK